MAVALGLVDGVRDVGRHCPRLEALHRIHERPAHLLRRAAAPPLRQVRVGHRHRLGQVDRGRGDGAGDVVGEHEGAQGLRLAARIGEVVAQPDRLVAHVSLGLRDRIDSLDHPAKVLDLRSPAGIRRHEGGQRALGVPVEAGGFLPVDQPFQGRPVRYRLLQVLLEALVVGHADLVAEQPDGLRRDAAEELMALVGADS